MASELICLNSTHISVEQMRMPIDQVLQCYIRNMSAPPSPLIENYLREAGFWHVATIGRGYTISASIFTSSSEPPTYISAHNEVEPFGELCWNIDLSRRYTTSIRPKFQWTPYEDSAIQAVIPDEFFQNPNIWHVKVPMVTYAIVEMHQSDRVLRQFGFRQPIPVAPDKLDDEHETDLRQLNTDWPRYWSDYIEMWENQYDYIPTREPIIVPELAYVPKYMPWFRIHGKPYLLSEEERRRQIRVQRERRGPLNPKRMDDHASPSIAATQLPGPTTAPPQSSGLTVQRTTSTSQPF
ncbi:hypothetical protein J1N35_037385 [Gossypium stocksii]|uniref:Aminotransferase-like plant mobile domain-containing protein n=1 Tax=Gossypium stocksii TaxID=47602 RepID=A0A9D3UK28_9ROSI|nr:hypothetical protein J1N35_037385 [Gossypium stocksii]